MLGKITGGPQRTVNLIGAYMQKTAISGVCIAFQPLFSGCLKQGKGTEDIGLDKLNMIKPMLKDTSYEETEEWIKKAEELPTTELREEIKEIRDRNKEKDKNLKDVFIDQYLERMVTFFNCSRKELNFKLALYFQDADMDTVRDEIRTRQRKFEETGDV